MTEIILVRHAENDWVRTGRLAGWTPGVHLNEHGRLQATALAERLSTMRIAAIYSSPLERTLETAEAIAARFAGMTVQSLDALGEVRFGAWQGQPLRKLRREPLWHLVQTYPSRVVFPGGESFREAQVRAVDALETLAGRHDRQRIVVVSHSDIIKLVLAHYLGMHLDLFQRIEVAPASLSILYLAAERPLVRCINDVAHLPPPVADKQVKGWRRLRALVRRRS